MTFPVSFKVPSASDSIIFALIDFISNSCSSSELIRAEKKAITRKRPLTEEVNRLDIVCFRVFSA